MSQDANTNSFGMAGSDEIRSGQVTDIYFERARRILEAKSIDSDVAFEANVRKLRLGDWAIFCGVNEVLELLEGMDVDLWALPEGTLFKESEPVLLIRGSYRELATYQTALLGLISQPSGIATKAARCVIAADGRPVYSFGARRMHPGIAPTIERAAYIGGCAGVASKVAAERLGLNPVGTIPHSLVLIFGDSASAMLAFDEVIEKDVKRVAIVDTFGDEKFEALENAELLENNIYGVRLETPSSRRGDMLEIAREVRWELDTRGYKEIKLLISGGIDEEHIPPLNAVADEYGVDTPISNAPVVDFSLGVVEVDGDAVAKRGTQSGAKQLYICPNCGERFVRLFSDSNQNCPNCDSVGMSQLTQMLAQGKRVLQSKSAQEIRESVLAQLPSSL